MRPNFIALLAVAVFALSAIPLAAAALVFLTASETSPTGSTPAAEQVPLMPREAVSGARAMLDPAS